MSRSGNHTLFVVTLALVEIRRTYAGIAVEYFISLNNWHLFATLVVLLCYVDPCGGNFPKVGLGLTDFCEVTDTQILRVHGFIEDKSRLGTPIWSGPIGLVNLLTLNNIINLSV